MVGGRPVRSETNPECRVVASKPHQRITGAGDCAARLRPRVDEGTGGQAATAATMRVVHLWGRKGDRGGGVGYDDDDDVVIVVVPTWTAVVASVVVVKVRVVEEGGKRGGGKRERSGTRRFGRGRRALL